MDIGLGIGMDLTTLLWMQIANTLLNLGIGCWVYLEKRNNKTNGRIDALSKRFDDTEKTVVEMGAMIKGVPSHSDLSDVYESVNRLAQTVNQLVGENRGQSDILRLILNRITEKGLP
jgi:hypothetical protein